jgi:hypothetical protein
VNDKEIGWMILGLLSCFIVGFAFGMVWHATSTEKDCTTMGTFRDANMVFECHKSEEK